MDEKTYKQTWQVLNSPSGLRCYSPYYQLVSHCPNFSQFRSATVQFSCAPTPVMVSLKCIVPTSVPVIAASQVAHKVCDCVHLARQESGGVKYIHK